LSARLLIVGLAPGVAGANRTGRPFTGDHAGILLYQTLLRVGLARGTYAAAPNDGLTLADCRIVNAVRCVPPGNAPTGGEIMACNRFLRGEIASLPRLRAVLALGTVAHAAVLRAVGVTPSRFPFKHGAMNPLPSGVLLADSYHVSRLNTNTGRLTAAMFNDLMDDLLARIADGDDRPGS
jgi:uracil-DNA glycosylase family 4